MTGGGSKPSKSIFHGIKAFRQGRNPSSATGAASAAEPPAILYTPLVPPAALVGNSLQAQGREFAQRSAEFTGWDYDHVWHRLCHIPECNLWMMFVPEQWPVLAGLMMFPKSDAFEARVH